MTTSTFDMQPMLPVNPDAAGRIVTCTACGCRLQYADDLSGWLHYSPAAGRDARGCRVECTDKLHDRRGKSLS